MELKQVTAYEFIEFLVQNWNDSYGKVKIGTKYLTLITGGWSDNEQVIQDAIGSRWFSHLIREYKEGGLYKFALPPKPSHPFRKMYEARM